MTDTSMSVPRNPLPRFEEAEGLGPQDAEFVRDLVAVLARHGNLNRFGLCLLHDHFPIAADEILVETNDSRARTLHAHVEKTDTTRHTKASQWRFLPHGEAGPGAEHGAGAYEVLQLCTTLDLCPGNEREGDH
ncbi:hypothetical protein A6P39_016640 [Streptomyces sp. FXJ1.172]|uniref:hypothetical protein n=1 Tax=Streptomyces sp. FXJ1.172 TaxID=710705 RepID=UPI0007CF5BD1|nr:hypothetical protein [Streptomyces sp. FXJ1.172]WEO95517.1 hypothetical protein A6P39_016640 [Streptomyces sp. FXJ1.172]